jgi:hypothetical protein
MASGVTTWIGALDSRGSQAGEARVMLVDDVMITLMGQEVQCGRIDTDR